MSGGGSSSGAWDTETDTWGFSAASGWDVRPGSMAASSDGWDVYPGELSGSKGGWGTAPWEEYAEVGGGWDVHPGMPGNIKGGIKGLSKGGWDVHSGLASPQPGPCTPRLTKGFDKDLEKGFEKGFEKGVGKGFIKGYNKAAQEWGPYAWPVLTPTQPPGAPSVVTGRPGQTTNHREARGKTASRRRAPERGKLGVSPLTRGTRPQTRRSFPVGSTKGTRTKGGLITRRTCRNRSV